MCRLFRKHCTLTIQAVGTTWHALPNLRRSDEVPKLVPLIASRDSYSPLTSAHVQSTRRTTYSCRCHFIFIATNICILNFYDLFVWDGCWSLVSIWRLIYIFLNVCTFDCTNVAGSGKVWTLNLTLFTPVGRLLSLQLTVPSRSVIVTSNRIVLVLLYHCIVSRLGVFVIRLRRISSFFSSTIR